MAPIVRLLLLVVLTSLYSAPAAFAQVPKPGKFYEDSTDLGFKVKMPKGWDFAPPDPLARNLIGKYSPPFNKYILLTPQIPLFLDAFLVKFDRRKPVEEPQSARDAVGEAQRTKDLMSWLPADSNWGRDFEVLKEKDLKVNKVPATEYLIKGKSNRGNAEFHVYAMVYKLHEDVEVAVVFDGPADKKKWKKYESVYKKLAKSFRRVKVEQAEVSEGVAGEGALRAKKRAQLESEATRTPGWKVYETPHYFILSNSDDKAFIKEVQTRLEACRKLFDKHVSFDEAERLRLKAAKEKAEKGEIEEGGEEGSEEEPQDPFRTAAAKYSPRERSVCSVVRICAKPSEYAEYGGPPGSAGYWWSLTEELVLYDAQMEGGRNATFGTLGHEAFHQYIFYLYGGLSPHDWYNEGNADYFGGFDFEHGRFKQRENRRRVGTIQEAIRNGEKEDPTGPVYVPLRRLIEFTHAEYYGSNELGASIGLCYAEGWSLVYFLRTGKKVCKDWDPKWDDILDVYYRTLASTSDLKVSLDTAFAGVDVDKMEEVWKDFVLKKM